jgi:hypothetical protein
VVVLVAAVGVAPAAGGVLVAAGASCLAQPPNWRAREVMGYPGHERLGHRRRRERRAWQPQGQPT